MAWLKSLWQKGNGLLMLLILMWAMLIQSCKKDDVTPNAFAGTWEGSYTGIGDNGTFSIVIASDGNVTGTATSTLFTQTHNATGTVNKNGDVNISAGSASSGAVFTGSLSGTTGFGTWKNDLRNPPSSGNWGGSKK